MVILNSTNMLPLAGLCFAAPDRGTNLFRPSYQFLRRVLPTGGPE